MNCRTKLALAFALLLAVDLQHVLLAQSAPNEFGNELLRQRCASCHAIGLSDQSRHQSAPPFRQVVKRYKPEMLAEALAEGILTGHPDMPVTTFEPHEIAPIIQYLEQLSNAQQ